MNSTEYSIGIFDPLFISHDGTDADSDEQFIFKFSKTLRMAEDGAGFRDLDVRSRRLLWILAELENEGRALSMLKAVNFDFMSSSSTGYNVVRALRDRGWVEICFAPNSARRKQVCLTPEAHRTLSQICREFFLLF